MLYFTESGWTLPDIMTAAEDFDRDYDQADYERKIARLIRKAYRRTCRQSEEEYGGWWKAIRSLEREDHYISVMIRIADIRPRGDQLRLLLAGLSIATCILLGSFLFIKYQIDPSKYMPSRDAFVFWSFRAGVYVLIFYVLLRLVVGGKKVDQLTSKMLSRLARTLRTRGAKS